MNNSAIQNIHQAPGTTIAGLGGIAANMVNILAGQGLPNTTGGWLSFVVSIGVSILSVFSRV